MIRFGTRASALARTQTDTVRALVHETSGLESTAQIFSTRGDVMVDRPLAEIGGKGLFTAELEQALREGTIDAAVHSLKDLPVEDPPGLTLAAILPRAAVEDVLIYHPDSHDPEAGSVPLAPGARVGTSSPRRRSALCALRPDLYYLDLRGNVPTRVQKLREGQYEGIVLAQAGIERLGLELQGLAVQRLPVDRVVPAPGQGALAVQCRSDDAETLNLLRPLNDPLTEACVRAERGVLGDLGGGCSLPLGALVRAEQSGWHMQAAFFARDGQGAGLYFDRSGEDLAELRRAATDCFAPFVPEPLSGRRVCMLRPGGESGHLGAALRVAGAQVECTAVTEVMPVSVSAQNLGAIASATIMVFTSARAVDRTFELLASVPHTDPEALRVYCVGPATAAALHAQGYAAQTAPAGSRDAGGLGRWLVEELDGEPPQELVFPCAAERSGGLEEVLRTAGMPIRAVPVYRTQVLADVDLQMHADTQVLLTSPSAVDGFLRNHPDAASVTAYAIGETTAAALRTAGIAPVATAANPEPVAIVDMLRGQEARS